MTQHPISSMASEAQMFKALGDEIRLRIIALLTAGELCVCDVMEVLGLPQSTASRHLAYLKNSGWVTGERRGKWMYYQINAAIAPTTMHFELVQSISCHPDMQQTMTLLRKHLVGKKSCF